MMKCFDYKCEKCRRTFEVFLSSEDDDIECPTKNCKGEVVRQLGGRPALGLSSGEHEHHDHHHEHGMPEITDSGHEVTRTVVGEHDFCMGGEGDNHEHIGVRVVRTEIKDPKAKA